MGNLIYSSIIFSVFAGILLALRKTMDHRYSSRFFYGIWVLLLLRLVIPMNIFQNIAPIRISMDQVQESVFKNNETIDREELKGDAAFLEQDLTNNFTEVPAVEKPLDENTPIQSSGFLRKSLNWNSLILLVWLLGVVLSLGLTLFSYLRFKKRIMKSITPMDSKHREAMEGFVDKRIEIFMSNDLSSPLVMGLIRPKLILIQSLFETNNGQLKAKLREGAKDVIHHELVHLQRKDMLVKYLYLLARTIHWFNPVINEDIELACDEQVAKTMDAKEKKNYCSFILDLASDAKLENSLYSTNFNGGLPFMKKRFGHIMESGKKQKGTALSVLLALVIISSALFVSCSRDNNGINANDLLKTPSYHLYPYRSEPYTLFYESDERIGFQVLDGIFIYNYKEDQMESAISLTEGAFGQDSYVTVAMGSDEKELVISAINASDGEEREYYYTYNLTTEKLMRINESPKDVVTLKYPDDERQNLALKALSFEAYDLRYYPNEGDEVYEPFKKENLPLKEYILEIDDQDMVIPPMLTLTEDYKFVFMYDIAASYLSFGQYEVDGDTYTLKTDDQDRTFVFEKEGDNLIFNEEKSFDSIMSNGKKLKDGSVFTPE